MGSHELMRLGGIAAIVGGAIILLCDVAGLLLLDFNAAFSEVAATPAWMVFSLVYFVGLAFVLCGLVALYIHHAHAAGMPGLAAFLPAFIGTAIILGEFWDNAFLIPSLALEAPEFLDAETVAGLADFGFMLAGILCFGGLALFGLSALWAGVYPRIACVIFVVGALAGFAPIPAASLILNVAVIWLGLSLIKQLNSSNSRMPRNAQTAPSPNAPEPARPSG